MSAFNLLRKAVLCVAMLSLAAWNTVVAQQTETAKPNILFISMDDLNDWVGCLGGHPQAHTPNLDRLAASGVLFANAHCPAPACNPCRTAVMTGISPHRSGLYQNEQKMREILPDAELLPAWFRSHGYWSAGSGKILHYFIDAGSWDEYYPAKETENPFPPHIPWGKRPKSLPVGGPWQYVETDWHAFDVSDEEFGGDYKVAEYVATQLSKEQEKPFFLACGIYRPHEPWFNPKKYFDLFPLDEIKLPSGYKKDDLADLPEEGKKIGPNRYFAHIRENGQWKQAIQGYLASIAFADANLGRVLDALESGPHRDNTIVVLWSDHGWHLGEKEHWQKYTGWRNVTRVPLFMRVPPGTPGLVSGTKAGSVCEQAVDLLSLYPTLTELAGIPSKTDNDGPSLIPLLKDADADWAHAAVTHVNRPGSYSLNRGEWNYIKYHSGGEELYHIATDPYEWENLAGDEKYSSMIEELRAAAPKTFAPLRPPRDQSLPLLTFEMVEERGEVPFSKPDGNRFEVVFFNESKVELELCWSSRKGELISYGTMAAGGKKRQSTRPGAVWAIRDTAENVIGFFRVGDRSARGLIPERSIKGEARPAALRPIGAPPKEKGLSPFYKKCLDFDGYLICSSEKVSDYALREASYLIELMLAKRKDIHKALAESGSRFTIMAADEFTTDVPEHASVPDGSGQSSDWWDRRARGLGGSEWQPVASCGEENLLCFEGDPYAAENILIHEFAHTIHLRGLNKIDSGFDKRLREVWDQAMKAGLWKGKYASTSHSEYFAEGVQSWFNNNRENDHDHNHVNTREELKEYDPKLADILENVFGDTDLVYIKPPLRKNQAHLEGFDYATAGTFRWPKRLKLLDGAIKRK